VLGAGFIGGAAVQRLQAANAPVLGLGSKDINLLDVNAGDNLAGRMKSEDTLVVISARAPVKSNAMLIDNLRMMDAVTAALAITPVKHVVYVSSDAVYADSARPLTENSCAQPASLHGVMHLAREVMLANAWNGPSCILRPTLVYGGGDPHNGYGPNRFRRLAEKGQDIVLFGEGEERRDHVLVEDVAEIICRVVLHQSTGVLNIATGAVASFRQIAEATANLFGKASTIKTTPRVGPMPHNGYRPFDATATRQAFPDFQYMNLDKGLRHAAGVASNRAHHG
jgi:UDP-glucose 4-epimerase